MELCSSLMQELTKTLSKGMKKKPIREFWSSERWRCEGGFETKEGKSSSEEDLWENSNAFKKLKKDCLGDSQKEYSDIIFSQLLTIISWGYGLNSKGRQWIHYRKIIACYWVKNPGIKYDYTVEMKTLRKEREREGGGIIFLVIN